MPPSRSSARPAGRDLAVDRLPPAAPALEVVLLSDASFGAGAPEGPRRPHRHDSPELMWTRAGTGRHLVVAVPSSFERGTVTLIGRGQVQVFERASGITGA